MFVKVFLENNSVAVDHVFEYKVPEKFSRMIKPAMRCVVPFGKGNKLTQAFVVCVENHSEYDESKLKEIEDVIDVAPIIPEYLIDVAYYLREEYFCTFSEALRTVLPSGERIVKKLSYVITDKQPVESLNVYESEIYSLLKSKGERNIAYLKNKTGFPEIEINSALSRLIHLRLVMQNETFAKDGKDESMVDCVRLCGDNPLEDYLMIIGKRAKKQREAVEYIAENGRCVEEGILRKEAGVSSSVIKTLEELGLIERFKDKRAVEQSDRIEEKMPLNDEQQAVMDRFRECMNEDNKKYLLFGVTGSGKTRVFLEMFDEILATGKQCLLLVPEISLTSQMLKGIRDRFSDKVVIVHSKLSPAMRYDAFLKVRSGEAKIVLGARSALFMPFADLGMVVIDEEHENSYKSSQSPRYNTIDVANFICDKTGATLLLSSATPSVESYYKAQSGEYELMVLKNRANKTPMPKVEIADMREELYHGNRTPISKILKQSMLETKKNNEQSVLFLNRRGFSTYVFCRDCGYVKKCPNCEVSLTYHASGERLVCHYCGHREYKPTVCPECSSKRIKEMGTGTEKIEQIAKELVPDAAVSRLDSDTVKYKGAFEKIISDFSEGKSDILIGTQMVAKGLDFDNVNLVGIILADSYLNFPDINASQRTYQLISQAAGRSGRRDKVGRVIMQTYQPQNPTIVYSANHDYESFYAYDIAHRQAMNYPPFSEIIGVFAANESLSKCVEDINFIYESIKQCVSGADIDEDVYKLYEPAPAFIQKLKNKYIYHTLIRYDTDTELKKIIRENYNKIKASVESNVFVEINPITLL
ncbi:MAG: primosomal protein N' [Anaerofustis stercorihominis]|nr:primosomal protein N' [Anaerofustis stercorihominis]